MKVCYWGTFERQYPRNSVLISGLRQNGIEVVECHFALWEEGLRYNKLTLLSGLRNKLRMLGRALAAYPYLILRYLFLGKHDAVVVGYLGHMDVLLLFPFARLRRKPIIFDAFFSLYDTAISDRGLGEKNSFLARFLLLLDRLACRLATTVLVDTKAQKEFFCQELGLPEKKVRWLFVGADDAVFFPEPKGAGKGLFRVLYVGNYVPLHGVSVIVEAAQLLRHEDIEFWFIGDGNQNDPGLRETIQGLDSALVHFHPWLPPEELRSKIAAADVCLGIFGCSDKAKRVIPGKAFLALAMGKSLITGNSPAARELLRPFFVQLETPKPSPMPFCGSRTTPYYIEGLGRKGGNYFRTGAP